MATWVLEDGSGIPGALAYADLSYVRDYLDTRGRLIAWDGTTTTDVITAASTDDNTITIAAHPFVTGDGPLRLTGADLPAGLATLTDYWIVVATTNTIKLATTYALAVAVAPTVINLTDAGSGTMGTTRPDFAAQRAAIIRATDYVEQIYEQRFLGNKGTTEQGLHWPASGAYTAEEFVDAVLGWPSATTSTAIEGVPEGVKRAVAEYAARARTAELAADGGAVLSESRSKGGLSRSVTYARAAAGGAAGSYPAADRWLAPLLRQTTAVRA